MESWVWPTLKLPTQTPSWFGSSTLLLTPRLECMILPTSLRYLIFDALFANIISHSIAIKPRWSKWCALLLQMNKLSLQRAEVLVPGLQCVLVEHSIAPAPLRHNKQRLQIPSLSCPEELYSGTFMQMLGPESQGGVGRGKEEWGQEISEGVSPRNPWPVSMSLALPWYERNFPLP